VAEVEEAAARRILEWASQVGHNQSSRRWEYGGGRPPTGSDRERGASSAGSWVFVVQCIVD
jgi:hypothetical protein